jgi:CelD/BcsL family acetyltransferase involved in cellulose biosynthesis
MLHLKTHKGDRVAKEMLSAGDGARLDLTYYTAADRTAVDRAQDAGLTVDVVRSLAGVAKLREDFAYLQSVTGNTLPFALYEWQLHWCRHFLRRETRLTDQPMFQVCRDANGTCVGIVPLILTQRRLGGLRIASLGLLGADPGITEIRTSLVQPGYEDRVAEALDRALRDSRDWDWIHWTGACDRFSAALGRQRALHWEPTAPSYALDLPSTWEEFRAGLKRNIRESLRHCYNSLKRDGHSFELKIATEPHAVQAALDRLFVLHAVRANMPGSVEHPNLFASGALRSFLYDVCGELAARGVVRVFQLEIAGQIVASRIGFVVGDSLYLYYSGFNPDWAKYSVMTTTVAEAIKYAIAQQGLKTVNLSTGRDISKTRWGPREICGQGAYDHTGSVRSRLVHHAFVKAKSGEGVQGWLLQRLVPGRRSWN